MKLKGR